MLFALFGFMFAVLPVVAPGPWLDFLPLRHGYSVSYLELKVLCIFVGFAGLLFVWLVGAHGLRLRGLWAAFRNSEPWSQSLFAAVPIMAIASVMSAEHFAVALIGSAARIDGALVVGMSLLLTPLIARVVMQSRANAVVISTIVACGPTVLVVGAVTANLALGLDRGTMADAIGLGHPALFGALMAIWCVFSIGLAATNSRSSIFVILPAIYAIGVGVAGGRAAMVALLVSAPALLLFLRLRANVTVVRLVCQGLLIAAGFALGVFGTDYGLSRSLSLGEAIQGGDQSFNSRLITWRAGVDLLAANPWFGIGQDGFSRELWTVVTPDEERKLFREFAPPSAVDSAIRSGTLLIYDDPNTGPRITAMGYDRSHNAFLDFGLLFGVPALILVAASIGLLLMRVLQTRDPIVLAAGFAFVAYGIYSLAWFWSPQVSPLAYGLLGVAAGMSGGSDRSQSNGDS
ncbi:MAG: O-antigen ligase family protein [Phycisphaerales bacterium JB060]